MEVSSQSVANGLELFKTFLTKYSKKHDITCKEAYRHKLVKETEDYYLNGEKEELAFDDNGDLL